jgi:chromosome segregation ATPase
MLGNVAGKEETVRLSDLQSLVRESTVNEAALRHEIEDLRQQADAHRRAIAVCKEEIAELRRKNTRLRSQTEQLVTFATTTNEFREFIIERVWISGASDKDMVMAMIAAMPEVKT